MTTSESGLSMCDLNIICNILYCSTTKKETFGAQQIKAAKDKKKLDSINSKVSECLVIP